VQADNEEETERLLKDAREHARAEREDDANELKRQMGKAITYGQVVQLRHVLTQYMLAASSTDAAELDVMNLDVSLSPETSRRTHAPYADRSSPHLSALLMHRVWFWVGMAGL
jgi:hypothetical protein